jgi:imidazolonepropionase-like amidohydrolase
VGGLDVGFRQAVDAGLIPGPRILASLVLLSPTNGMVDATTAQGLASPPIPGMPSPNCDGPDQARAKVREVLRAGADLIKIATTGGVSSPRIGPHQQVFTRAEVDAIVEEAHMAGVPVACHAHGGPGLAMAIRAGVDCIEHAAYLDDELAREMAGRGTWLVPTFTIVEFRRTRTSGAERAKAEAVHATHTRALEAAMRAGVRIALGTDTGAFGYGGNAQEFELLVQAGMPVDQAIQAGTRCAAECLGLGDQVGTLEPGKEADLLVVDGDPLVDPGVLRPSERLVGVWKAGQLVAGRLTEPRPSTAH